MTHFDRDQLAKDYLEILTALVAGQAVPRREHADG